jgi:hypothetical protein
MKLVILLVTLGGLAALAARLVLALLRKSAKPDLPPVNHKVVAG